MLAQVKLGHIDFGIAFVLVSSVLCVPVDLVPQFLVIVKAHFVHVLVFVLLSLHVLFFGHQAVPSLFLVFLVLQFLRQNLLVSRLVQNYFVLLR